MCVHTLSHVTGSHTASLYIVYRGTRAPQARDQCVLPCVLLLLSLSLARSLNRGRGRQGEGRRSRSCVSSLPHIDIGNQALVAKPPPNDGGTERGAAPTRGGARHPPPERRKPRLLPPSLDCKQRHKTSMGENPEPGLRRSLLLLRQVDTLALQHVQQRLRALHDLRAEQVGETGEPRKRKEREGVAEAVTRCHRHCGRGARNPPHRGEGRTFE
jgi:hypothetical protein